MEKQGHRSPALITEILPSYLSSFWDVSKHRRHIFRHVFIPLRARCFRIKADNLSKLDFCLHYPILYSPVESHHVHHVGYHTKVEKESWPRLKKEANIGGTLTLVTASQRFKDILISNLPSATDHLCHFRHLSLVIKELHTVTKAMLLTGGIHRWPLPMASLDVPQCFDSTRKGWRQEFFLWHASPITWLSTGAGANVSLHHSLAKSSHPFFLFACVCAALKNFLPHTSWSLFWLVFENAVHIILFFSPL